MEIEFICIAQGQIKNFKLKYNFPPVIVHLPKAGAAHESY
jgi:hypothetical protein